MCVICNLCVCGPCCVFSLKDHVLHVGESRADAFQQQVEGLDGDEFCLSLLFQAVFSSRAQRETQMQLKQTKFFKKLFGSLNVHNLCLQLIE